jgi:hypothetical protein
MFAACLHLIVDQDDAENKESEVEWNDSLAALPPSLIASLAVHPSFGLPSAVSALTALTRLERNYPDMAADLKGDFWPFSISAHHLQPLMQLRQLSFEGYGMCDTAEELLSLPALAGLQALDLPYCCLKGMP